MFWLNLLLFLILTAGHAELMVAAVNRTHSWRLQCGVLRHIRHVHDALVLGFPLVLLFEIGLGGPRLLTGGSWSHLPLGWAIYFGVCVLGFFGLVYSSLRWMTTPKPAAQLSNDSWTVDLEQHLGYRPVGPGPFRFMTTLPKNELFKVEVSEKTYRLPRLPTDWDGLSILHLSDFHFIGTLDKPFYEQVVELSAEMKADLVVFTGDLLDRQQLSAWIPDTLGRLSARLGCFFILGNHDWYHGLDPDATRRCLSDLGWQDVAGQTVQINHNGKMLAIAGTELPWMGRHPDLTSVPERSFRLLLSHTPDNLSWARSRRVDLMLAGHNHGGQVVLPVFGPVYSPSRHGVRYAGGAYWQEPTLLHVSRGLSGRYPLRLNCPPEVTKLILRCPGPA